MRSRSKSIGRLFSNVSISDGQKGGAFLLRQFVTENSILSARHLGDGRNFPLIFEKRAAVAMSGFYPYPEIGRDLLPFQVRVGTAVKITSKGQVTIPQALRERFGL